MNDMILRPDISRTGHLILFHMFNCVADVLQPFFKDIDRVGIRCRERPDNAATTGGNDEIRPRNQKHRRDNHWQPQACSHCRETGACILFGHCLSRISNLQGLTFIIRLSKI